MLGFTLTAKVFKQLIIGLIRFYQRFISPLSSPRCRFYPTCSQYALEAVQLHGAFKGSWLGARRVCRCHPWGGSGVDFVPLPVPDLSQYRYSLYQQERCQKEQGQQEQRQQEQDQQEKASHQLLALKPWRIPFCFYYANRRFSC